MPFSAQTTVSLIARLAIEVPQQIAFSDDAGKAVTCSELWDRIRVLARAMERLGIGFGARVAIRLPNCIEWSIWEYASHAIGALPVGIGMQWSNQHANDVLASCDATVLVVQNASALAQIDRARLGRCRLICALDSTGAGSTQARWVSHSELLSAGPGEDVFTPRVSAEDAATIVYTSGSTGKPKGIMHTHTRVMAAVEAIVGFFPELEGGRLALSWMPMEHLFQRILNLVSLAFRIETRVLRKPDELIATVRDERPTYLAGVPFAYEQLLHAIESAPSSFAAWQREVRLMIVGAAPTLLGMLERFSALGFPIRQAYSTSECIVPIASNTLRENRAGSVGRPHAGYAFRLSEDGEIRVRGPGVFTGYVGEQDRVVGRFDADGYFRTGDFGYLDSDGYLFVTGRAEDFLKTSTGRRISPFEVESAYKQSDLIEHIVVVGHARKHLLAIVQLEPRCAEALAVRLGLAGRDADQWSRDERMTAAVLEEMRRHESGLDPYKRVRGIVLLPHPLSIEGGELTPTLKLRRDVILKRWMPKLDALFGTDSEADGHAA
jgi:long-chain acyl-CoA synthetase